MEWAVKILTRATGTDIDVQQLTTVATFCCFGLLVSLVAAMVFGPGIWADLS